MKERGIAMMFNKANEKRETMDIEKKLRKIIEKRIEEDITEKSITHQEMYERMVEEAVLLISAKWEECAKYMPYFRLTTEPLGAINVFYINKGNLNLFTMYKWSVNNPKTERYCFTDSFEFESMEEVEKYVEDVKSRLPEKTMVLCEEHPPLIPGMSSPFFLYSFEINVFG